MSDQDEYIARKRVRILGYILMRELVEPWAEPTCSFLARLADSVRGQK